MAEYYPLLARAVSAQANATPEIRNGIYERARKALIGQLRAHEPPLPEEDIDREAQALEAAIARVEADQASAAAAPAPETPPELETPPPFEKPSAAAVSASPPAAEAVAKPRALSLAERARAHRDNLAAKAAHTAAPARADSSAAAALVEVAPHERRAAPLLAPGVEPGPDEGRAPLIMAEPKAELAADPHAIPKSGLLWKFGRAKGNGQGGPIVVPSSADEAALEDEAAAAGEAAATANPDEAFAKKRMERPRPMAPLAEGEPRRSSALYWALGFVAALIVVGVAVMAYFMKDSPKTVEASRTPPAVAAKAPDKIIDRIGIGPTRLPDIANSVGSLAPAGTLGASVGEPPTAGAAPAQAPQQPGAGNPSAPSPSAPSPSATAANGQPSAAAPAASSSTSVAAVAQRAALLLQAPTASDPQAIATYVGNVVWRLETVNPGPGKPAALAVRAEINVPDAKFKASMLFEKNFDSSLPASHTIELRFAPAPGSVIGDIKQIDVPQMRKEDSPAGDALAGVPTPITDNYFLVGLAKGDPAQSHNIELIRAAGWFDVPMLLANGKIAKITFEKGVAGQKVLDDAFASWSR